MKWFNLFKSQIRNSLRSPWAFFFVFLAVAVSVLIGTRRDFSPDSRFFVAVVNEDEGSYGARLVEGMAEFDNLVLVPMIKADALSLLRQDRLEAVFVIRSDYTYALCHDDYHDLIDWYMAPSSRAAATISEPLIICTMRLFLEEQAVNRTRDYLVGRGLTYTADDEQIQRDLIRQVWENGASIQIVAEQVSSEGLPESATEAPAGSNGNQNWLDRNDPLAVCIRWYAVLIVFYLVINATWILDINRRGLRIRITQSGAHLWQLLTGISLAPLLIGMAGYWLTGFSCCLFAGGSWIKMLLATFPVAIYLWGVIGLMIALTSFIRQSLALLFLAPLVTFIHAVLSGLAADLPDWAALLAGLSKLLPGRWLLETTVDPPAALPAALLCCFCWLIAGILCSEIRYFLDYRKSK